jgi:aspartyl protease family protein
LPAAAAPQGALALQRPVPTDTLVYRANPQGHVMLDAVVNGVPVHFLVDTGASFVALTMQDAAAAGIAPHQLQFTRRIDTANGQTRVAPVRLREIRIGQLAIENVAGVVHEHLSVSLLGQTFLNRLQSYEMRDGVLTITW